MHNALDPDEDQRPVSHELGPNILRKLSADDKRHP